MNEVHQECRRYLDAAVHTTHRALADILESGPGLDLAGAAALRLQLRETHPENWSGDDVAAALTLVEAIDELYVEALDAGHGIAWDQLALAAHHAAETTEALGLVLMDLAAAPAVRP